MTGFISHPSIAAANATIFAGHLQVVEAMSPDYAALGLALKYNPINMIPAIPVIIGAIYSMSTQGGGTGYGKVLIHFEKNQISDIEGERRHRIMGPIVKDEELDSSHTK